MSYSLGSWLRGQELKPLSPLGPLALSLDKAPSDFVNDDQASNRSLYVELFFESHSLR